MCIQHIASNRCNKIIILTNTHVSNISLYSCVFYCIETWILYSGAEQGVSKVVRDAYKYYEDMEFKTKSFEKEIIDPDRHVKLISMAGNKVQMIVNLY